MAIDPDYLLSMPPIVTRQVLTPRDTILYALGVGATELDFLFEERLKALPTMAVTLGYPGFIWRDPALGANWQKILHGEQSTILHAPLPVEGEVVGSTVIEALYDKGADKGALAMVTREIHDGAGTHLATSRSMTFLRGDGGFGGSAEGAPVPHTIPDRAPDDAVTLTTATNLAQIYRLSGDLNPLHIDPDVARAGGFEAPILHGLATYGVIGRALLAARCGNDPARLKRIDGRFSAPVYPGETIETSIWDEEGGKLAFRARVVERDKIVFTNGYAETA
ncbi:MaoC/PaaZ C-terminal domain-containing protein [Sphingopyxis macrogoltabida]|uniref:3-alpha,7-alpha, 12-alpha-trihydroxy-5-beta-cholest-24-enoyl-CoA hydratase n=1 Tax=Sphingopyxis macrogoltabida TaxID=33050 RepID=A0AAC9AU55_SPHMC|nr:MaoC/PaaZ C-terminal domain-containing protein [Sphingopyxis macrogoltabida]ALJ11747.1 3-alpha,7-alpha, 12-alpha-trihydroxy-5-beta-cholest-24-enoyl-CoA hydratase [Sphingopyxis macrogoltabida]AMU87934.1 3-alpha,7-alpha, 12-alpha-trihydroxy-5-beta-cholest-24-enoyl-CoA hydratase [Sphingopyxis macrogoltabida]